VRHQIFGLLSCNEIITETVTTHLNATLKIALKIIGLIILLVFLYFIETLIFLLIFGEGGQASSVMNNRLTKLIMYVSPLFIVGRITFKMFKKT
jgi:hypothetical protein